MPNNSEVEDLFFLIFGPDRLSPYSQRSWPAFVPRPWPDEDLAAVALQEIQLVFQSARDALACSLLSEDTQ